METDSYYASQIDEILDWEPEGDEPIRKLAGSNYHLIELDAILLVYSPEIRDFIAKVTDDQQLEVLKIVHNLDIDQFLDQLEKEAWTRGFNVKTVNFITNSY